MSHQWVFVFLSLNLAVFTNARQVNPVLGVAPVIIGGGNQTCPAEKDRTSARESLSNTIRSLVRDVVAPAVNGTHPCGQGNWIKIAHLNMSDPSEQCPPTWRLYTTPLRACGRPVTTSGSCPSTRYSAQGYTYDQVCGRAIGYQFASTDAFITANSIDSPYVDGLSVTHGSPRQHIWTFAAGHEEDTTSCPCSHLSQSQGAVADPPSYVGNNFFCEAGQDSGPQHLVFYSADPLWDGRMCQASDCCTFNTPPYFNTRLPSTTTDDIEVRICGDEDTINEDTPISLLEIYIA